MVDVPLRHKSIPSGRAPAWAGPPPLKRSIGRRAAFGAVLAAAAIAGGAFYLHDAQQDGPDLVTSREPVSFMVAGHTLVLPANTLRTATLRHGGPTTQIGIVLHWPELTGYSDRSAADFTSGDPRAPIVYATISPQQAPLDATTRLDTVYSRFFTGKALPGPAGLVGRALSADSGFGGEVVYFMPSGAQPFVARCLATETPEVPTTCLRDINFAGNLTLLYRFDRSLLGQWQLLEAGMRRLATNALAR